MMHTGMFYTFNNNNNNNQNLNNEVLRIFRV